MIRDADEFVALRTSTDARDYIRATTESAEPEVWFNIVRKFPGMKVWVVRNKTVPAEVLHLLSSDPDPEVRTAVAMKNKLPRTLIGLLANDSEEVVRDRIVFNKNTDESILEQLANDPVQRISLAARDRLSGLRKK